MMIGLTRQGKQIHLEKDLENKHMCMVCLFKAAENIV